MARVQGVSKNTIQRVWQDHGLKPHLTKSFKLSGDPRFLEKLTDVVALQVLEGRVIGKYYPRHRHQEFLQFLQRLDAEFPGGKALHLILDNYGTHGHARVQRWLARHPRFVLHFIPTSSSWLNLIERWFAELSQKAVRRGSFTACVICNVPSARFSPPGMPLLRPSCGPPAWSPSSRKSLALAKGSSRSNRVPRCPNAAHQQLSSAALALATRSACLGAYADLFTGHYTSSSKRKKMRPVCVQDYWR